MAKITGSTEYTQNTELDPGVFASKQEVVSIENKSNHPSLGDVKHIIGQKGFEPEICLVVKMKTEDGYEKDHYLFGKYVKDTVTGKIKGWVIKGNAVLSFLYACVGEDNVNVNDDWSIPQSLINKCIGRQLWKIDYANREYVDKDGKTRVGYQNLNTFFPINTTESTLIEYWYSRRTGIKDYRPEIYTKHKESKSKESTSFNFGANAEKLNSLDDEEAMV